MEVEVGRVEARPLAGSAQGQRQFGEPTANRPYGQPLGETLQRLSVEYTGGKRYSTMSVPTMPASACPGTSQMNS